jgi:hypothetical protein
MEKTKMTNKLSANNRNSIGRFVQGSSGNPNGRPVGSKNKFTTLKSAFIDAFEEIGGVDNLVEWARCNQTEFYRMVARLLPREVEATLVSQSSLVEALMEVEDYVKYERTLTDNGK